MSTEFERLQLTCGRSQVSLIPYAAHVLSWLVDGRERLYLSEQAEYRQGVAIRGGVPIIFPQFAGLGAYPKHGFARNVVWQLIEHHGERATLRLQAGPDTAAWPHQFSADYQIVLSERQLQLTLTIGNVDVEPWEFTAALHTYLRVHDIAQTAVSGLQGMAYRDSAAGGVQRVDADATVTFAGEVDRIYWRTPSPLTLLEQAQPTLHIHQQGFTDSVVWNPGPVLARKLADMPDEGYRTMVCVEAAVIETPVRLLPGQTFSGSQTLQCEPR